MASLAAARGALGDLRKDPVDAVLCRVEEAVGVRLDRNSLVRKRRTLGARTDRGTWVRIERRPARRVLGQGWNGAETASLLAGVAQPRWYGSVTWRDGDDTVMWRADESELLPDAPIKPGGVLVDDPGLPEEWWSALNATLDALASQSTGRITTPDTVTITQEYVNEVIRGAFPSAPNTRIQQWTSAHADLNWANVTGPRFSLFDWEDWGMAPRGLDAASLWAQSLAVPTLANRVRRERHDDLASHDGTLMMRFTCAKIAGPYAHPQDPRLAPAQSEGERLAEELHAR